MHTLLIVSTAWALLAGFVIAGLGRHLRESVQWARAGIVAVVTWVVVFVFGLILLVCYQIITFPW